MPDIKQKKIVISGVIGFDAGPRSLREDLKAAKGGPVLIEISSPGGFVYPGIEMFNLIRDYEGHTEARITGLAASMASYIPLAADKVSAHDNAVYMIHNALALAIGNHNDLRKTASWLEGLSMLLAKKYAAKTGKTLDEVRALMDDETFLFGDEMLHEGFVDEIIETAVDGDDMDSAADDSRAQAVALAREAVTGCMNQLRQSEDASNDMKQAAAFFADFEPAAQEADVYDSVSVIEYASASAFDPQAPFPNEHACRVREPGDFQPGSFRRITRESEGKKFDIIIGRIKGKTTTTTQAFRYQKDTWTEAQARRHCNNNNGKRFEPATGSGGGT